MKAIEKLPSVNFQSADAFDAYEWSARITIRGFNQSQLGFTLDDVPLGDMSKRYSTYENDQSVPSQTLFDLALGYRFSGPTLVNGVELQLTITNLFDEDFISTINSNGFPIRDDSQALLPGAPREVFVTLRKSF